MGKKTQKYFCPTSERVKVGVTSFTTNFNKLLAKILLPVPINICSACLEVLVPKG